MHNNKKSLKVLHPEEIPYEASSKNMWNELRIKQNISARSYHSSVIYNDNVFIYGGYEANTGILSDFYSLNLTKDVNSYEFIAESHQGAYPGSLQRHSAIVYSKYMFIYGGKQSIFEDSNKLYRFDFEEKLWELIETEQSDDLPPCVDSHNAAIYKNSDGDEEMIIFGGFVGGKLGKYSRSIYAYSFKKNKWRIIFDGLTKNHDKAKGNLPKKRSSAGMVLYEGSLYVFGGANSKKKFNDIWKFDLERKEWIFLKAIGEKPSARCGHLMSLFANKIIVFGGIHDVAHEKNDLFLFNISTNSWTKIDSDFAEIFEKNLPKIPENKMNSSKSKNLLTPKMPSCAKPIPLKIPFFTPKNKTAPKGIKLRQNPSKSPNKRASMHCLEQPKSPYQTREERLKQRFLEKKSQLLAEFETNDDEKIKNLDNSPITEIMKKSINSLNLNFTCHSEKKEYTTVIKENKSFVLNEKKPCARDGCTANLFNNKLIFFGGDRNNMTFKDVHSLDLEKIV